MQRALGAYIAADRDPSPRVVDIAWVREQPWSQREAVQGVLDSGVEHVAGFLKSACEHVIAMERLFTDDAELLPLPAFSLARSVQEAALLACWLADPAASPERRAARAAAVLLGWPTGTARTLAQFPVEQRQRLERAKQAGSLLVAHLEANGFRIGRDAKRPEKLLNVSRGSATVNIEFNATDAAAKYTPGSKYSWSIGSGASHSQPWLTKGIEGDGWLVVSSVLAPVLDVSDALVDNVLGYVGIDPSRQHEATHLRRRAVIGYSRGFGVFHGYEEYARTRDNA